ncbi:hypothetical protein AB0C34_16910 [Nocardia sp. NPDC049220]|uniref:hypothetical protein n=1 Tax=Nocardia sp. NPDC049220 TaxID=3155273 RepID=UPI0033C73BB2
MSEFGSTNASDSAERGPGRPPIGDPKPIRLGKWLTTATDAQAEREGRSRAALVRRAVHAYVSPGTAALADGAQWTRNRSGDLWWGGEFNYPSEGESRLLEDWNVFTDKAEWDDAPPGTVAAVVTWQGNGGGPSQSMSMESAEALGRSLLSLVAVHRLAKLWDTSVAALMATLVEELTGELDPPSAKLEAALRNPERVNAALARLGSTAD